MRFIDIINDVEGISLVKDKREMVKRAINYSLQRVHQSHNFPYYLQDKGVIETKALYNTGTVTSVQGDATINGVLTVFDSSYAGWKFRKGGENPYYRIKSITSGTELELETTYKGETDAVGEGYEIYKDEYRLAPDIDQYKFMRQVVTGGVLFSLDPANFDLAEPAPSGTGNPDIEVLMGSKLDIYTTGSVSGTANSNVLTGVGTSWLSVDGLGRLSKLRIGDNVYIVKSVDSDTQITLYDKLVSSVSTADYEINLNNLVVLLHNIPSEANNIYYRYFRIPSPLVNDYDVPDMPNGWEDLLMWGALSEMFVQKGDIQKSENKAEAMFLSRLNEMKLKVGSFTPDRIYYKKPMNLRRTHVPLGKEPSGYRWYSG